MELIIIISSSYILDFIINDKFEVENLSIQNQTKIEDLKTIDKIDGYNHITDFRISVPVETYFDYFRLRYADENNITHVVNLTERYNYTNLKQYNLSGESIGFNFKSRVSEFEAELLFCCGNDSNCNDFIDLLKHEEPIFIGFEPLFPKIDHQNPLKPILEEDKYGQYEFLYLLFPIPESYKFLIVLLNIKKKKVFQEYLINYLD